MPRKKKEKKPERTPEDRKRMKGNILAIAIAVVFLFFIMFGVDTFMDDPERDCECNRSKEPNASADVPVCGEEYQQCREELEEARNDHKLKVFIIMAVVGIAAIAGSFFIFVDSVSTGIMGGGLLTLFIGAIENWSNFHDWMRFIVLGVVLFILVWLGYKKLR
ncbi:MAG: hypothetical protein ACQEP1_02720 [Nanobdellota archaeon]